MASEDKTARRRDDAALELYVSQYIGQHGSRIVQFMPLVDRVATPGYARPAPAATGTRAGTCSGA